MRKLKLRIIVKMKKIDSFKDIMMLITMMTSMRT